jgi:hypothetical protein
MSSPDASATVDVAFSPVSCDLEDLRAAWRDACEDLVLAYRAWRIAGREHSAEAFWVVIAAVDREEAAAEVLCRHTPAPGRARLTPAPVLIESGE